MAAPVVAKAAVSAANSKTGRKIIAGILAILVAVAATPMVLIGVTANMIMQAIEACNYDMPAGLPDWMHPMNDPRVKAVCLASKATGLGGGAGGAPPSVVGGWANPVGMQSWGTYPDHAGGAMDIHVGVGTPVYAPAAGTIFDLSESCGGMVIGVQHDVNYTTAFAHMSSMTVSAGQTVSAGDLIGYSGESGSCVQGAHLHFEVRVGPNPNAWGNFTPAYKFMRENGIEMGPCTSYCDYYPL